MFFAGPVYVINLDLLNFLKNEYPEKKVSEICKNSTLDYVLLMELKLGRGPRMCFLNFKAVCRVFLIL